MNSEAFLFWFLACITVFSALTVFIITNPVYSALSLVMTMIGVAGLFVTLNAYFIAGVQMIIYAGAVMVLFVMVLMLFDLKAELQAFSRGLFSGATKLISLGLLAGLLVGALLMSIHTFNERPLDSAITADNTRILGKMLLEKYLFEFESLGVLLLVVAVGAVVLSRSKGGTHAKH